MSTKFMSWTLNEPNNGSFSNYAREINEGEWEVIDADAWLEWGGDNKNFWSAFMNHSEKIRSIGLHDFGLLSDGTIYNYKSNIDHHVVSEDGGIDYWIRDSLRYLIDTYPKINWYLQIVCFGADRVNPMLDYQENQDRFIEQFKIVTDAYLERFPEGVTGIEMDFEKSNSRGRDMREPEKYCDLLIRVKNEICIPRGLALRVNLHAMQGDFNPSWYGWTDYRTLAQGRDQNGSMVCDEWQIMSYDFAHNGSSPGPSTPVWWLKEVIAHAVSVFPASSVWIGNAAYGRRWPLHNGENGVALRYWQLLQWQNGLNKHNIGRVESTGAFTFVDQSYLPFVGWHDQESGYQRTFLHLYDRFNVDQGDLQPSYNGNSVIFRTTFQGTPYITSYSKHQNAQINDIKAVVYEPDDIKGNAEMSNVWQTEQVDGEFKGVRINAASYLADNDNNVCVLEEPDGEVTYSIDLESGGEFRLIAAVYFPYLNPRIPLTINGDSYVIGEDIDDWYPFLVNPDRHFYDCGTWDFETINEIKAHVTSDSAQILGFIVCGEFDHGLTGGYVNYGSDIQRPVKRTEVKDNKVGFEEAELPNKLTVTAEVLRRHPRPVIFWEDTFSSHARLNENGDKDTENLTETNYYQRAIESTETGSTYDNGRCVGRTQKVGFSSGQWEPFEEGYTSIDSRQETAQLVLNKPLSFSPHIETDVSVQDRGVAGIRFYAKEAGETNDGYLFLLDFEANRYRLLYESNGEVEALASAPASISIGSTYTIKVRVFDGQIRCMIGNTNTVISYDSVMPTSLNQGAHGIYASGCRARFNRVQVATNDRYEPMEKLQALLDGNAEPVALQEERPYAFDEFGYLEYQGFSPDENLDISIDNDYENRAIATVDSWEGVKDIRLRLLDAGVWVRSFYVGDSEGYSIAWNSDLEGFITTLGFIDDYDCKGVAMWTIGQEDPRIFTYLTE